LIHSSIHKALGHQLKLLIKKNKDTTASEQELAKDIDALQNIPGFPSTGLEYASRLCRLVPFMKTEAAKETLSEFYEEYAHES
jgi:hypothetical protein